MNISENCYIFKDNIDKNKPNESVYVIGCSNSNLLPQFELTEAQKSFLLGVVEGFILSNKKEQESHSDSKNALCELLVEENNMVGIPPSDCFGW